MNFKRIGRCLVCLLLVCALMVNISPLQVRAVSAATPVIIEPDLAFAASLGGLGVMPGDDPSVHTGIIGEAIEWFKEAGDYVSDGLFAYKIARSTGDYGYFVEQGFLQKLFEWMWDVEVVSVGTGSSTYLNPTVFGYSRTIECSTPVYFCLCYSNPLGTGNYWRSFVVSDGYPGPLVIDGKTVSWSGGESKYYFLDSFGGPFSAPADFGGIIIDCGTASSTNQFVPIILDYFGVYDGGEITTDKDLTLNKVGAFGSILPDSYPEWFQNSTTITDSETGEEKTVVPIALGQTLGETQGYSQDQIWAGNGTYVDTDTETGAGTADPNPDVTPDTNALTQAGFDASLAAFLAELGTLLIEWFEKQFGVISSICAFVESIYGTVERISQFVADIFNILFMVFDPILEWLEKLVTGQTTIIDSIIALPGVIGDVIAGVLTDVLTLVFVPSEGFVVSKVEALTANFPWVDPILASGVNLKAFLSGLGATPPVIYIDLGATEGSYNLGGKQVFMDLTWYSAYKGTMDTVSSAFIYLWLGWRVFMTLPGLINGSSGLIGPIADRVEVHTQIKSGPPRKKE